MLQVIDAHMVVIKGIVHPLIDGVQYIFGISAAVILHMDTQICGIIF